jgi:hypothetical protein
MSYQKSFLKFKLLLLIIISGTVYSCTDDENQVSELNENRRLWESNQIVSYSINEETSCFCGGVLDWELTVEDSIKTEVDFDELQLSVDETYDTILERARTINEIFDFLKNLENQNIESIVVEYHTTYGFPTLISIDYNRNVSDDEVVYSYTNFTLLN